MRIPKNDTAAVVIDIQEKLFPHIYAGEHMLGRVLKLVEGLEVLQVPLLVTEQYTKGLGPTVFPLHEMVKEHPAIEKMTFSCCGETAFMDKLRALNKKYILLCGIETHVCVLQTALDLLEEGFVPVLVADAVSSRHEEDKKIALRRIERAGGILTSTESILFELCQVSGTAEFKQISKIVK
jgi:nicotinamidase-related amidase